MKKLIFTVQAFYSILSFSSETFNSFLPYRFYCPDKQLMPAYLGCTKQLYKAKQCEYWKQIDTKIQQWQPAIDEDFLYKRNHFNSRKMLLKDIIDMLLNDPQVLESFQDAEREMQGDLYDVSEIKKIAQIIVEALMRHKPHIIPEGKVSEFQHHIIIPLMGDYDKIAQTDVHRALAEQIPYKIALLRSIDNLINSFDLQTTFKEMLKYYVACPEKIQITVNISDLKGYTKCVGEQDTDKKTFTIDAKHIFKPEKSGTNLIGFHHDYMNMLQNNGIVQVVPTGKILAGAPVPIHLYQINYDKASSLTKTLFPSELTQEQIITMIMEVVKTQPWNCCDLLSSDMTFIKGIEPIKNLSLKVAITPRKQGQSDQINVISAYPEP